jgi:hypothetical protein
MTNTKNILQLRADLKQIYEEIGPADKDQALRAALLTPQTHLRQYWQHTASRYREIIAEAKRLDQLIAQTTHEQSTL